MKNADVKADQKLIDTNFFLKLQIFWVDCTHWADN